MTFKALRLDERDVFVELVTLEDEAQLTERHVDLRPFGGDCDRPVGEYRWNRTKKALEALPRQQRAKGGRPTLEQAVAFDMLARWERDPASLTEVSLTWLDGLMVTMDFTGYVRGGHPLIVAYIKARGLESRLGKGE
jgi:hypothetical protein